MAANHPAKKMKIEEISDEKSIADPFVRVHEHVRDLMLQHLTGREVLRSMKVSKDWNEIVAESRKCMSKVKLKIEEKTLKYPSLEEVTALMESDRPYQHMKLRIRNVKNSGSMLLLLQRFSQSLVELDLKLGKQKRMIENLPENVTFPKLKLLKLYKLTNVNQVIKKLFANVFTLKKFEADDFFHLMDCTAIEWLKKQNQLKEFTIRSDEVFNSDVLLGASFKFEYFSYNCIHKTLPFNAHLDTFLLSQADSLVHLKLDALYQQNVKTIFNRLPNLKTFSCCFNENVSGDDLEPNRSIIEFTTENYYSSPPQNLLKSLVNLEILKCTFEQKEEVSWAFTNLKNLKKYIHKRLISGLMAKTVYKTLKESGALGVREIEII
jgi:hypothetical protein